MTMGALLATPTRTPPDAGKVFAITELFELILLNVDPVRLFALQRVNTHFRDTIKTTKSIKQRMLLDEEHQVGIKEVIRTTRHDKFQAAIYPFIIWEVAESMHISIELPESWIREYIKREGKPQLRDDTPCLRKEGSWRHMKFPPSIGAMSWNYEPNSWIRNRRNNWAFLSRNDNDRAEFGDAIDTAVRELRVMLYSSWHQGSWKY